MYEKIEYSTGEGTVCYFCFLVFCFFAGQWFQAEMAAASVWAFFFLFFNEVCLHFVHPATRARESASLRGFDLLLPGLQRSLLESASSEVIASPCALQLAGEERGHGPGTAAGGNATVPELGRSPPS